MDILYYAAASLDGFIATPDGGIDWLTPFDNSGEDYGYDAFYASIQAVLMGSKTYAFCLEQSAWPYPEMPSYVFTRRALPVTAPNVHLTQEEPAAVVAAMEGQGIERAWLLGGGELASSFRRAGLLTGLILTIIPVLLGEGIPLFAPTPGRDWLRLAQSQAYPSGVVQLEYRPREEERSAL